MAKYIFTPEMDRQLQYMYSMNKGSLKAEVIRRDREGKAHYFIRGKDLTKFIITHSDRIDLRKVEKYYFIELVANGAIH